MKQEMKRLFFGAEISAPWPTEYPKGRLIAPASRHLTLAFLGDTPYLPLKSALSEFPSSPIKVSPVGVFDHCLFLPEKHPRVVAWNIYWLEAFVEGFQRTLVQWLNKHRYSVDSRPLLSHVTLARDPFVAGEWEHAFVPLPLFFKAVHLYESVGNLTYLPLWTRPFIPPFQELDHTADIAYLIQADTIEKLHLHAEMALAFRFPPLLEYREGVYKSDLNEVIIALNRLIAKADSEVGCPLKAVSFHGNLKKEGDILQWRMIADV